MKSLGDSLEYAILELVFLDRSRADRQESFPVWASDVRRSVPQFENSELLSAFKRLRNDGIIRLTKPDFQRRHAMEYSDSIDDDVFFLQRIV